jgi:hypothetical protein
MHRVDLESSEDDISEIQAEIAHLSTVSSDHITRYYGSFVRGWRLWIVMEYLAGGSCLDLVRGLRLSLRIGPGSVASGRGADGCPSSSRGSSPKRRLRLSVGSCWWVWNTSIRRGRSTGTSKPPTCFSRPPVPSSWVRLHVFHLPNPRCGSCADLPVKPTLVSPPSCPRTNPNGTLLSARRSGWPPKSSVKRDTTHAPISGHSVSRPSRWPKENRLSPSIILCECCS